MKTGARLFVFSLALTATNLGFAGAGEAADLRSATEVNRPTVKLSDVFDGLPAAIDCDIARAPAPGKSITYDVNVLIHLAQQYKLDWQPQGLSDHTTITTTGTRIASDDIRPYVIDKVKDLGVKGDIDVLFDSHMLEITVPSDRSANLVLNNFGFDSVNKRFHADLMADGFSGPLSLPLSGHIVVRHNLPVLAHRLEAGTIMSATDVDWQSVPDDHAAGAITSAEQLIGHELQHTTDAGVPVRERDVIPPRLVVRGTLVTMKIETSLMVLTVQGRALQDGKLGDTVRVSNTQSNRVIEGIVESDGMVRVNATQKIALATPEGKQE